MVPLTVRAVLLAVAALLATGSDAAVAQTSGNVSVCGIMTEYRAETDIGPGSITVAGEQFAISSRSNNGRSNISADARVGSQVCLNGRWVMSQTVGRNLIDVTLAPQAAAASPAATPGRLPATSAGAQPGSGLIVTALALGFVALAAVVWARRRRA